jgi:hypothetical protein
MFMPIVLPFAEVCARLEAQEPTIRELFINAHAITTQDPKTGQKALLYGKEILQDIAKGRASEFTEMKNLLCVEIDNSEEAQQLEFMIAAVTVLRGSCCYDDLRQQGT